MKVQRRSRWGLRPARIIPQVSQRGGADMHGNKARGLCSAGSVSTLGAAQPLRSRGSGLQPEHGTYTRKATGASA